MVIRSPTRTRCLPARDRLGVTGRPPALLRNLLNVTAALYGLVGVQPASGNRHEVDIIDESCTCPHCQQRSVEDGRKHLRRVAHEAKPARVPRPDGRLPETSEYIAIFPAGSAPMRLGRVVAHSSLTAPHIIEDPRSDRIDAESKASGNQATILARVQRERRTA